MQLDAFYILRNVTLSVLKVRFITVSLKEQLTTECDVSTSIEAGQCHCLTIANLNGCVSVKGRKSDI